MANRNKLIDNNHHALWPKRQWVASGITRLIREHPGLIVHRLYIPTHNRLHQEIPPIKPMSAELGKLALQNIRQTDIEDGREGLPYQADYLWHLASQPDEIGDEAYIYAQHLEWQIDFLGLGKEAA